MLPKNIMTKEKGQRFCKSYQHFPKKIACVNMHLSPEPYQPHSILPNWWGAHAVTGVQNSLQSPLSPSKEA